MCWYEFGESFGLGPEIVRHNTEKVKMIQEKVKALQSRKKCYRDKLSKALEFQEGDYVYLRVTLMTGVDRALKSQKLMPHFIGPSKSGRRSLYSFLTTVFFESS